MQRVQRQLTEQRERYSQLHAEVASLDQLLLIKTGQGQAFDPRVCLDIRRQIQEFEAQCEQVKQTIQGYESETDHLFTRCTPQMRVKNHCSV